MPRSKLTIEFDYENGIYKGIIKKKRGKLTLDEIEEFLRYENQGRYQSHYIIVLNCSESSCGGSGWMDDQDPPGDCAVLYQYNFEEPCPVCAEMTPPEYCPNCGEHLSKQSDAAADNKSKYCINAEFTSVWDGGTAITTDCKVNLLSREIYDIRVSDDTADLVNELDEEYIVIDGERFPACQKGDAEHGNFWYD